MRNEDFRAAATLWTGGGPHAPQPALDHAGAIQSTVSGNRRSAIRPGIARLASILHPTGVAQQDTGLVSGGRQHASGAGRADGGDIRTVGRSQHCGGPRFDRPVPSGGYAWWYIDALSEDGAHGLTLIALSAVCSLRITPGHGGVRYRWPTITAPSMWLSMERRRAAGP